MFRPVKTFSILLPALLFMIAQAAQAEYCMDYSGPVKNFLAKNGSGGTRACWPTQEACESYRNKNQYDSVHKYDFSGGCYPSGGGSGFSGGGGSKKGKGSMEGAIKHQLVEGILNGLLNPPAPKKKSPTQPNTATIAAQQKIQQQLLAEKAAQEAAYASNQKQLLVDLKGDIALSKPNTIDLKMPPEPSAIGQLGLLEREGKKVVSDPSGEVRSDWENPPKNVPAAILPKVPEPGPPVSAENEVKAKQAQDLLRNLLDQVAISRQKVDKLDQEVKQLESTVTREEQKISTEKKPDDDALRKAREALQRAKENREKAAAELRQLEEQEKKAQADMRQMQAMDSNE